MNNITKVISRIKGGLGNQLFCYAAARRLALVNSADLAIDDTTGFVRDRQYRRQYALDRFQIPVRKATWVERLHPFERYRRGLMKRLARRKPFGERSYVELDGVDFDARVLALRVKGTLYLDGLWQSEEYFKDVEHVIRRDLQIIPPTDSLNRRLADDIYNNDSVALHVRWFDAPDNNGSATYNVSVAYYQRAIELIESKVESPRYFVFSDNPDAALAKLRLPKHRVTFISHNQGDENAFADLWLMTQCRAFITANSTFSWWGAWLGSRPQKIVLTPDVKLDGMAAWGFNGLIPAEWLKVQVPLTCKEIVAL